MQKFLGRKIFVVVISLTVLISNASFSFAFANSASSYSDPYYVNSWQWGLAAINSDTLAQEKSHSITVAIIDSGLDIAHPEFAGRIVNPHNFTNYGAANDVTDETGHGTHVAGIIAAANNGSGMNGVAGNVNIMPLKIFSPYSRSSVDMLTRAINYAVENGADVINMSLSAGSTTSTSLKKAIENAENNGCILVAATGNDSQKSSISAPACFDGVIAVSSANYSGNKFNPSSFANYDAQQNEKIIYAPGENILSTYPTNIATSNMLGGKNEGRFQFMNGTSMSTAFVSGVCALLLAQGVTDVKNELFQRSISFAGDKYLLNGVSENLTTSPSFHKSFIDSVSYTDSAVTEKGLPVSVDFHFSDVLSGNTLASDARVGFYNVDRKNLSKTGAIAYSEKTDTGNVIVNLNVDDKIGMQSSNYFMFFVENNGEFLASDHVIYSFPASSFDKNPQTPSDSHTTDSAPTSPVPTTKSTIDKNTPAFDDIPEGHWASEAIYELASRGIINGKKDDMGNIKVEPEGSVTRAEFVKMLYSLHGSSSSGGYYINFIDVNTSDWFYTAVAWAVATGVSRGAGDDIFEPDAEITREEMAVMMFNYSYFSKKDLINHKQHEEFIDAEDFADWSRIAIEKMTNVGVFSGFKDGTFRPHESATRAESMMVMWKLLD